MSRSAKSGVTRGVWTVSITATTAASKPEISTAAPITRPARTPSSSAVRKSIAAARMCSPTRVRPSSRTRQQAGRPPEDRCDDRDLADVDAGDRHRLVQRRERRGDLPERTEPEQCDALQEERDCECRDEHHGWRLPAQRPEDDPVHQQRKHENDREAEDDPPTTGQPRSEAKASAYAPAITSCPYAKLTSRRTPKTSPMPTAMSA